MDLYAQRTNNIRRTWALVLGFLIVVIAVGYAISWYYNDPSILDYCGCYRRRNQFLCLLGFGQISTFAESRAAGFARGIF